MPRAKNRKLYMPPESPEQSDPDDVTSSDSDIEVKHLTFPNRGLRWPVGSPLPKNPVRGTRWNKYKGLRLESKDQQDMTRYVPGRLPKLLRKAEAHSAADYLEGGGGSLRAICQFCKVKIPFDSEFDGDSKELIDHLLKCWTPTDEPPYQAGDERNKQPNINGEVACEEDLECMIITIHSPGAFKGGYVLAYAFPLTSNPDLAMLDSTLRNEWFEEYECPHLSMFFKRECAGSLDDERKHYSGFAINKVVSESKKDADDAFLKFSINNSYQPCNGRIVWAREHKGIFWPAVVMEENSSKILARRDSDEGDDETWPREWCLQWHVIFLNRGWRRMWVRESYNTFRPHFTSKDSIEKDMVIDGSSPEGEKRRQWEEAIELGLRLKAMNDETDVLNELTRLGLDRNGDEIKDCSMWEMLVDREGVDEAKKLMESWKVDKFKFKWSFHKPLYRPSSTPHILPVEKTEGFSYWPLMGLDKMNKDEFKELDKLLVPDRTDTKLSGIFLEPGETALYQFDLVDGYRSRCKIQYHDNKIIRLRGKLNSIPCGGQLVRDPEYERDVARHRSLGNDIEPSDEDIARRIHSMPSIEKPSLLAKNESPFIPCSSCRERPAEFCDPGDNVGFRSFEDPDLRFNEFVGAFCCITCARDWSEIRDIELPTRRYTLDLPNSPRAGVCQFSNNIFTPLHLMSLHNLDFELFGNNSLGKGLYGGNGRYIDDERAEGRHHPLWPKAERRKYRDRKRRWQDLILGRIEMFGFEMPPVKESNNIFYD